MNRESLEYSVGNIGVPFHFGNTPRPCPTYRRGSLTFDLREDMSFVAVPFTREDETPAVAIVLRWTDGELFGTSYAERQAANADEMVILLNAKLDEQRAYYRERRPPGTVDTDSGEKR
jgi:hypothetical protein